MKKFILPIGLAVLLIAACGKKEDATPATGTNEPSSMQPTQPAATPANPSSDQPATTPAPTQPTQQPAEQPKQ